MPAPRYTVQLAPSFVRDLERLPKQDQEKVLEAVKRLEVNPLAPPPHVRKLKAKGIGQWRLRIGVYRVRYDVARQDVVLYRVRHRKDIYRN